MSPSLVVHVKCMFFLGKDHVGGVQLVKGCIYVGNVQLRLQKGPAKGPTRMPQGWWRHCLAVLIDGPNDGQFVNQRPVGEV